MRTIAPESRYPRHDVSRLIENVEHPGETSFA